MVAAMSRLNRGRTPARSGQRGATLVEAAVVLPLLLFMALAIVQAALLFYARSVLTFATAEAARAGAVAHGDPGAMAAALRRAMLVYYGGGRSAAEVLASSLRAQADLHAMALRIEVLSPTAASFADYNSPERQRHWATAQRVIPNSALDELSCPRDRPACNADPTRNASGQTLADANLLKLRVTYGVPPGKQVPLAGKLYVQALRLGLWSQPDTFVWGLLAAGRIPVVTHTVVRMQSDGFESMSTARP